jgi:hypothetical protein
MIAGRKNKGRRVRRRWHPYRNAHQGLSEENVKLYKQNVAWTKNDPEVVRAYLVGASPGSPKVKLEGQCHERSSEEAAWHHGRQTKTLFDRYSIDKGED